MTPDTMERKAACLALAVALAACGGETEDARGAGETPVPAGTVTAAAESGYTVIEVADGGTIRGTVRFTGTVPPARTVAVTEDAEACGASQQVQTLEVGPGQGLANAVVSLVDITEGAAMEVPASAPTLDQQRCRFLPRVLLAPAGATVDILNSDPITHNVHTVTFENRPLNRAQPSELRKIEVTFPFAEKVKVRCDIHEWMGAWVVVMGHPYYTLTDRAGRFVIAGVPPGTYTLEAWHETLGATTQTVTVAAGQTTDVSAQLTQN